MLIPKLPRNPCPSYPKLLFDWTGVGLGIQPVHVVVHGTELIGGNGGVTAKTRLQNGIMDKDILLLKERTIFQSSEGSVWS